MFIALCSLILHPSTSRLKKNASIHWANLFSAHVPSKCHFLWESFPDPLRLRCPSAVLSEHHEFTFGQGV